MEASLKNLKKIATAILSSETEDETCSAVQQLTSFYNQFPLEEDHNDDIQLNYGYALSVKHAADCIKDYKRTVAFIKGIYQAILSAIQRFKGETINVLYAGCGPYAPLIVPLLTLFKEDQLKVTIIDVNPSSIESVTKIIDILQFNGFMDEVVVADAISYQYPKAKKLHVAITETMFHALTREPQVAITENLKAQITEDGYLIPEKIELKMGYSFFSKEPFLNQNKDTYAVSNSTAKLDRKCVKSLFELKNTPISSIQNSCFESDWMQPPFEIEDAPDVCIFTSINVFKDIHLQDSDSLITNPYCLGSIYPLREKGISRFKVRYSIEKDPSWQLII